MRIQVLATTYPRRTADTWPSFVHDLARQMVLAGDEVSAVVPHSSGSLVHERMDGVEVHRFRYAWPASLELLSRAGGVAHNARSSLLAKLEVPAFMQAMHSKAKRLAHANPPEVIHSHWIIPSGLVGARVARRFGARHVITLHSGDVAALARLPGHRRLARSIVRDAHAVLAVSQDTARRFLACLAPEDGAAIQARLAVLPMGVSVSELRSDGPWRPSSRILFLGRLAEKKGLLVLLAAAERLLRDHPRLEIVVAGSGPLQGAVEAGLLRLPDPARFKLLGAVSHDEKLALLRQRPILVLPSIASSTGDLEGLPVVALEGLAAGCPVVASASGGLAELIEPGVQGSLVPPGDPDALAEALDTLLRDPALAARLAAAGQARAEAYDWPRIAQRHRDVYRGVAR